MATKTRNILHALPIFLMAFLFCKPVALAQKSLKLDKQPTTFFYLQANLHGGYTTDINGKRFDVATRSPRNQLILQAFRKNQRILQKGYIKNAAIDQWKVRIGFEYNVTVSDSGYKSGGINFALRDTWFRIGTKWDRTKIHVGNKSIPYGHNPKIDPVSDFMINPISMDLGFAQDIGVFLQTPLSPSLDLEASFTSGGWINKPLVVCNNIVTETGSPISIEPGIDLSELPGLGTWLFTGRAGSPSFKKLEFGFITAQGIIRNTFIPNDIVRINRFGFDGVFKYKERFKWVNQFVIGRTESDLEGQFLSINLQNNMDFFTGKNWMFSASHSINALYGQGHDLDRYNWSVNGSITKVFSPHTRLRLNGFYTLVREMNEIQSGVLIQFVTGIGKRP